MNPSDVLLKLFIFNLSRKKSASKNFVMRYNEMTFANIGRRRDEDSALSLTESRVASLG